MFHSTTRDFACESPATGEVSGAPAAGLIALGLNTLLFGLYHADLFPFGEAMLAMGLFYGALGQIAAGLTAWRKQNAFGTVLCTAFGLFWLSQIALVVLPATGFGWAPQAAASSIYLAMWGLFTTILFNGSRRLDLELAVVFALLAALLFLLAAGIASGNQTLLAAAGCEGIGCGFSAIYAGVARLRSEEVEQR